MLRNSVVVVVLSALLMCVHVLNANAAWSVVCFGESSSDCVWVLVDGGPRPVVPASQEWYYPDQSVPDPDPCSYRQLATQPDADSAAWRGGDPAHGRLWETWCPDAFSIDERNPDGTPRQLPSYMGTYYVPDGTAPGQGPDVSPQALLARATGNLTIPAPTVSFGPDATQVAVKVPVWLWIEDPGPITVTTRAGSLSATVTATLDSTTWQMGEPYDVAKPFVASRPVECAGGGTAYRPGADPAHPPCGYTYIWRSLPERTAGTGTWPVTVTAHYTVAWSVSTGTTGTQQVDTTTTVPLQVREWHVVLTDK